MHPPSLRGGASVVALPKSYAGHDAGQEGREGRKGWIPRERQARMHANGGRSKAGPSWESDVGGFFHAKFAKPAKLEKRVDYFLESFN